MIDDNNVACRQKPRRAVAMAASAAVAVLAEAVAKRTKDDNDNEDDGDEDDSTCAKDLIKEYFPIDDDANTNDSAAANWYMPSTTWE